MAVVNLQLAINKKDDGSNYSKEEYQIINSAPCDYYKEIDNNILCIFFLFKCNKNEIEMKSTTNSNLIAFEKNKYKCCFQSGEKCYVTCMYIR